jgi:hypothetical protein
VEKQQCIYDPLGELGSTPLYLCLPPVRGFAGGDCYFPITCGNKTDTVINGLDQGVAEAVDLIQVSSELSSDEPDQGAAVAANLILRL